MLFQDAAGLVMPASPVSPTAEEDGKEGSDLNDSAYISSLDEDDNQDDGPSNGQKRVYATLTVPSNNDVEIQEQDARRDVTCDGHDEDDRRESGSTTSTGTLV